jgi:hypothetical protein
MPISWNEIRHNAVAFAKEWAGAAREDAEAKTFWDEFFKVFGIKRRTVASFEEPVKNLSGNWSYIDLFWKATLLVEHKSLGKPLDKAQAQAMDYIQALKTEGRDDEIPRYVIVSDFARIALHDLEEDATVEFTLDEFHRCVDNFAFIPGYKQHKLDVEDPINIRAVELLGELHDVLKDGGYSGHDLERFLVRVLFCLFAEDTGLFDRNSFTEFIENHTRPDGSDLGVQLARLFQVLNTERGRRQKNLLEELAELPYVNGDLFAETLGFADFNRDMRNRLLACCRFDWSRISPAVFGSLFQSVMEPRERRQVGAHYTSERDIMKVIRSLFLDDLRSEFESVKTNKKRLKEYHEKLGKLTFLDPACGCGNFLVVAYRELRLLEIEVLKILYGDQQVLDIHGLSLVDVDAMYGIEINEFPARIAEVALWLVDHQMNQRLSEAFGKYFARLPLKKSATIKNTNALRIDWKEVLAPEKCSYVLGNPPFVGKHYRKADQRTDLEIAMPGISNIGDLDYVAGWYFKAGGYIRDTNTRAAFVSTNSITQGEQVSVLWHQLFRSFPLSIHFAHRTFAWQSEARGKAHVHVVIIGFACFECKIKSIYDYEANQDAAKITLVENISPYLTSAGNTVVSKRLKPLAAIPNARCGNKPTDGGNFILSDQERQEFVEEEPEADKYIKRFTGSEEFINGNMRWCLWLRDASPAQLRAMPRVLDRVRKVREFRLKSSANPTQKAAETPTRFFYTSQPACDYILIPEVSSERRRYIPMGIVSKDLISANTNFVIPSSSRYLFGVLTSAMHMAWVRLTCGRLKSDYRYSGSLVYNTFPWPESPTNKQITDVEAKAQAVLDARVAHPDCCLADLYDPLTMPSNLSKAHADLDRAVDACYRAKPFESDHERVEFLFGLYEKLVAPLTAGLTQGRARKKKAF